MGPEAVPRIAAESDELPLRHREFGGLQPDVCFVLLVGILPLFHQPVHARREMLQVTIHAGVTLRMRDIYRIAEAELPYGDTADVTVADGHDGFSLNALGTEVKSPVEVVGTRFTKVSRQ